MDKIFISKIISGVKVDENVQVFVHNIVDDADLLSLFVKMPLLKADVFKDDLAQILAITNNAVAYRTGNAVYVIPATVKAVINNNDGKLNVWFDYPCEMKVEDLEEY